jgi:hypothetical protein
MVASISASQPVTPQEYRDRIPPGLGVVHASIEVNGKS